MFKEIKTQPVLEEISDYKNTWIQHVDGWTPPYAFTK
jgi:hypothetical protein